MCSYTPTPTHSSLSTVKCDCNINIGVTFRFVSGAHHLRSHCYLIWTSSSHTLKLNLCTSSVSVAQRLIN